MFNSHKPQFLSLTAIKAALAGVLVLGASTAMSAVITTNEAALDSIFSQTSFGSKSIDVRFTASQTLFDTNLLSIDSQEEWNQLALFSGNSAFPVINMFFVDAVAWCGGPTSNTIGCASQPGTRLMLDSDWTSGTNGGALAAHELAHNLGLGHLTGVNTNLMNEALSGNTFLSTTQASTILGSNLIRFDGTQRYITVTPILVAASIAPVPEPETWAMMLAGLIGVAGWVRRSKTIAA